MIASRHVQAKQVDPMGNGYGELIEHSPDRGVTVYGIRRQKIYICENLRLRPFYPAKFGYSMTEVMTLQKGNKLAAESSEIDRIRKECVSRGQAIGSPKQDCRFIIQPMASKCH